MKRHAPTRCPRCAQGWICNPADHACEDCLDALANRSADHIAKAITAEHARMHGAHLDELEQ